MLMDSVNALALWYSERYLKCVSAFKDKNLLLLELCYRPAKTGKIWNYLRCLHVFNPVPKRWTDMKEGNWLQLLYYFFVFMDNVAPIIGFSWFSLLQVLGWRFLVLHFYGNVYIWFPELIWSHMDWILCFFATIWPFSLTFYLYGMKFKRFDWYCFPFNDMKSFCLPVWGIF